MQVHQRNQSGTLLPVFIAAVALVWLDLLVVVRWVVFLHSEVFRDALPVVAAGLAGALAVAVELAAGAVFESGSAAEAARAAEVLDARDAVQRVVHCAVHSFAAEPRFAGCSAERSHVAADHGHFHIDRSVLAHDPGGRVVARPAHPRLLHSVFRLADRRAVAAALVVLTESPRVGAVAIAPRLAQELVRVSVQAPRSVCRRQHVVALASAVLRVVAQAVAQVAWAWRSCLADSVAHRAPHHSSPVLRRLLARRRDFRGHVRAANCC